MHNEAMSEYRFDPATYPDLMREEVPAYERLQRAVGAASAGLAVSSVLDLGIGTGETLAAVHARHPDAAGIGVDKNDAMLEEARQRLQGTSLELRMAEVTDPLPPGPFDLVVSALAIHHLEGPDKADLFARITGVLRPGGRFVLGDVVIPVDPADAVTPVTPGHDRPSTLADQLGWLADAGLDATVEWSERDLVVVRADRRV
jgi:tRNA (cmo5U34)-methyltransferase